MGKDVDEARQLRSLPVAILAYAIALAAFLLVPPILRATVGPVGFTLQEAIDLFTPIVVLPLAWWMLECLGGLSRRELLVFLVIAIVWVEGQAIHLATNAIGDVFSAGPARDAFYGTGAGNLDHWFDEGLGHWMWHLAWAALSVLMLFVASRRPAWPAASAGGIEGLAIAAVAGVIQGVTFFFVTVEGETTLLGVPFSIAVLAWTVRETARGSTNPAIRFFLASAAVTLLAYVGWIALEGWPFAEPCAVIGC